MVSGASALSSAATCQRASSSSVAARSPQACGLAGLPHCRVRTACILAIASARGGVVALWSR